MQNVMTFRPLIVVPVVVLKVACLLEFVAKEVAPQFRTVG
jgi:hypothetical protein